jgi:hypothetical protein
MEAILLQGLQFIAESTPVLGLDNTKVKTKANQE